MAVTKIQKQATQFKLDYQDHLEHLQDELVVGSEEYNIASAIDHLFYNKLTGGLVLVDYKTNSTLKGYNDTAYQRKYTKKMKVPLNHIDDNALNHYYIQLSIYRFLIEKYTGLKVDEMFIVYMSENIENYEIIEIPYLKDEVEKILEWRKWE
jgi:ATP-dependent exoDNAse (exonuclease V) beta subunit